MQARMGYLIQLEEMNYTAPTIHLVYWELGL